MFSGDELVINGKAFGALDRVNISSEINTIETYALGNMSELRQFVSNYDEILITTRINTLTPIRNLVSTNSLWDEVETQVRAICLEQVNKEISDLEPEPGFVIGLRALVNTLARRWAERY